MGKNKAKDETLGVFGLVALIIGSTIGTGVFTTAVNMAADLSLIHIWCTPEI